MKAMKSLRFSQDGHEHYLLSFLTKTCHTRNHLYFSFFAHNVHDTKKKEDTSQRHENICEIIKISIHV